MKAIILAGGEGTRLRPVTSSCPKPMVKMFDRPVIDGVIALLKNAGITDVCVTVGYMPQSLMDHLGDGSKYGINISYSLEDEPLGTAGGVKKCEKFIDGDDFIVISGDCVCSFDLRECIDAHRSSGAFATVLLYRSNSPLEYGLAVTDGAGRIIKFIEKPSWDRVVTDLVNTGIYIFSKRALDFIPENQFCDFGKDFFPSVLDKEPVYGAAPNGYWCDIGSPDSLLSCLKDCLDGKTGFIHGCCPPSGTILSAVPDGTVIVPPVYIGKNVKIGDNCRIGPYCSIGRDSVIGDGARLSRSCLMSCKIGADVSASGAIIMEGANIKSGCTICDGSVIGSGVTAGDGCGIAPGVSIYPNITIPPGSMVTADADAAPVQSAIFFGAGSRITGRLGSSLTIRDCCLIGSGAACLGKLAVAWDSESIAAASAVICGALWAGGHVLCSDSSFASCAAFFGRSSGCDLSVFIEGDSEITMHFFDRYGLPLGRDCQRKIELALRRGQMCPSVPGQLETMTGAPSYYASAAASVMKKMPKTPVSLLGRGRENRLLKKVFSSLGLQTVSPQLGVPCFSVEKGGFSLKATDESGCDISPGRCLCIVSAALSCEKDEIAVSYSAPSVIEKAAGANCSVLRQIKGGRKADELYGGEMSLHDGIFSAVKILSYMGESGKTLQQLSSAVPEYYSSSKRLFISGGRAELMEKLRKSAMTEAAAEFDCGLKLVYDRGTAYVSPAFSPGALDIRAEGATEEDAAYVLDAVTRSAGGGNGSASGCRK